MVASQVDSSNEKKHCDTVYESVYHGLLSANFDFSARQRITRPTEKWRRVDASTTAERSISWEQPIAETPKRSIVEIKNCQFADGESRKLEVKETKLFQNSRPIGPKLKREPRVVETQ